MHHATAGARLAVLLALLLLAWAAGGRADVPIERPGRVENLPVPPSPHWIWAVDLLLERFALLDLDGGRFLGMVSSGYGTPEAAFSPSRGELYSPETYYSRKVRGERTDVVSIYELRTLAPVGEVAIPPKRAINVLPTGNVAFSDDERFLAVFNLTPATSLSIVDVRERRFAGEIDTPGCSLAYAAGDRRFLSICMDGALLVVTIDDAGREASVLRTRPFFDPLADPVTEKAVRIGDRWVFVSFAGLVHEVDVSGTEIGFGAPWSLLDDADVADSWRIGGIQHLAVHRASGRLYSLMHQGGSDTHKDAGSEIWVYDLATQRRVLRVPLHHPGLTVFGISLEFGQHWLWPFDRLYDALLWAVPGDSVSSIQVTQGAQPLLVTGSLWGGSLGVYDATSGELRRRINSGNFTIHSLHAPFGARE